LCPFDRLIEGLALRLGEPIPPLRRLCVHAEREAGIFVAELIGRITHVVSADAPKARVGAA
jgi:hypothetical protein